MLPVAVGVERRPVLLPSGLLQPGPASLAGPMEHKDLAPAVVRGMDLMEAVVGASHLYRRNVPLALPFLVSDQFRPEEVSPALWDLLQRVAF